MTRQFSDAARYYARISAVNLGWRPEEFWRATPADLINALCDPETSEAAITRGKIDLMMEQERHG